MRLIRTFLHLASYALVKVGVSMPQRYNWHDVWAERGEKVDCAHVETVDGRPSEDEINAIAAVKEQLTRLNLFPKEGMWLDVGVGSGLMHYSLLKENQPNTTVSIGCDYSHPSLRYCKNTYQLPVANCSAEHLPFSSGCFDFILFYSVSHYLSGHKNFLTIITEFERVLKPGGAILVGDVLTYKKLQLRHFNPRWFYPDIKKIRRDIHKQNLDIIVVPQPECAPYHNQRVDWVLKKADKLDEIESV